MTAARIDRAPARLLGLLGVAAVALGAAMAVQPVLRGVQSLLGGPAPAAVRSLDPSEAPGRLARLAQDAGLRVASADASGLVAVGGNDAMLDFLADWAALDPSPAVARFAVGPAPGASDAGAPGELRVDIVLVRPEGDS